jgi:hypothetical protein
MESLVGFIRDRPTQAIALRLISLVRLTVSMHSSTL